MGGGERRLEAVKHQRFPSKTLSLQRYLKPLPTVFQSLVFFFFFVFFCFFLFLRETFDFPPV